MEVFEGIRDESLLYGQICDLVPREDEFGSDGVESHDAEISCIGETEIRIKLGREYECVQGIQRKCTYEVQEVNRTTAEV